MSILIEFHPQYIAVCAERDRLKAELEEQKIGHFKASVRADTFEMDLFTARKQHITFRDDMAKLNQEIAKDRDLWKSKAEKLYESLDRLHDHLHRPCVSKICFAKATLAEFDKNGDWRDKVRDVMDKGSQTL